MNPRWYLRITLWVFGLLALVIWGVGGFEFTIFSITLLGLAVALASTALAYALKSPNLRFCLSLVWIFAGALFVERTVAIGLNGFLAVGAWLVLSVFGIFMFVRVREQGTRSFELTRRAAAREQHRAWVDERRQLAERAGLAYEERSAALAEGFGRLEQEVPKNLLQSVTAASPMSVRTQMQVARDYERMQVFLEHAAGLEAESVIRTQVGRFPITLFELEVIDYDMMVRVEPQGFGKLDEAAEVSKRYLSVGMVTLPFPLPLVSSAYAYELGGTNLLPRYKDDEVESDADFAARYGLEWNSDDLRRRRVALVTENDEAARLLMSVPAVRESALTPDAMLPWFVDGDRLVSSDLTPYGTPPTAVQQWIAGLGRLVEAFPWSGLERFRAGTPAHQAARSQRFFRTFRPGPNHGAELERWDVEPTESGIRLLKQRSHLTWRAPPQT